MAGRRKRRCPGLKETLDRLYETYWRFIYKEAWKYRTDPAEVEELVQEVWVRICQKASQLASYSQSQQCAYLVVVVRNTAITLGRSGTELVPLESADTLAYVFEDMLLDRMDRETTVSEFRSAWQKVPPQARSLLERKYLLNESDAEIAEALGIGKNSVRMALTRARKAALRTLQEELYGQT